MGPFQKMDTTLEQEITKLEMTGKIPRLDDILQTNNEEVLKYSSMTINFLAILFPFILAIGVYLYTSMTKDEINHHRSIIQGVQDYSRYKTRLAAIENAIVSTVIIKDQKNVSATLNSVLSRGTKTSGIITITDFEQNPKGETILITDGRLEFNNFSQDELSNLIRKMVSGLKMKIVEVEIFKDEESNFLKGMFRFTHYGKK